MTLLAGTARLVFSLSAMAQDEEADDEEESGFDEVVVTGTRIAKRDAIVDSPITTLHLEAFKGSSFVTVDQYLNAIPQIVPNLSSQSNNPSSNGRAFI